MSYSLEKVVKNDFCVGCGACVAMLSENSTMDLKKGLYQPTIDFKKEENLEIADKVCPFSDASKNEDELAETAFETDQLEKDEYLGYIDSAYAGYSRDMRQHGASGGIITWLISKLLEDGLIDYVITVGESNDHHPRFQYQILSSTEQVKKTGGSAYYPISFNHVLKQVREVEGRYAFVGIPCFNKSIRSLKMQDPVLNDRIVFQIGLVCGHLKTKEYGDYLIRLTGSHERKVKSIHFRRKSIEGRANEYMFEATEFDGKTRTISNKKIGNNWGMGVFKPKACDYCDDVYAEGADAVCMDAWLPQYIKDGHGISLFMTRNKQLDQIIKGSIGTGELVANEVAKEELIESQAGGIRHRRRGLKYRLHIAKKFGWVPKKRLAANSNVGFWFKIIQIFRILLRRYSKVLFSIQKLTGGHWFYTGMMFVPKFIFKVVSKLYRKFDKKPSLS